VTECIEECNLDIYINDQKRLGEVKEVNHVTNPTAGWVRGTNFAIGRDWKRIIVATV